MKKEMFSLFCAALLASAAAHAEPQIVVLPTLAPEATVSIQADEYAVDLSGFYANGFGESDGGESQYPSLTGAEKARAADLLSRYASGGRPEKSVLNQTENVVVGVYPLKPEDFQGEAVFVLLPGHALSDEELLELIDGYAQLGLSFDPEGLSWRNCMRGGAIESNRGLAGDEFERMETLTELYTRQGLRPQQPFTAIPGDDSIGEIQLNEDDYGNLPGFRLRPCRRMTDEELLRIVQSRIGENIPDTTSYSRYEGLARAQATALFGAPLSAKLTAGGLGRADDYSSYNDDREVYVCSLEAADGQFSCILLLDTATELIYTADVCFIPRDSLSYSDLRCDPFDESWLSIARDAVTAMTGDALSIASVDPYGEGTLQYGGYCACVTATMTGGSCYEMRIPFQTGQVSDLVYRQIPVLPEQSAP